MLLWLSSDWSVTLWRHARSVCFHTPFLIRPRISHLDTVLSSSISRCIRRAEFAGTSCAISLDVPFGRVFWVLTLIEEMLKGKVHPRTGHEGSEGEQRYSSNLSLTSALDKGGWPRPGRYTPRGKTQYPLYRGLGGPQGRSGQVRKISPLPGLYPRTVQPVASRYTDWAIPAHI